MEGVYSGGAETGGTFYEPSQRHRSMPPTLLPFAALLDTPPQPAPLFRAAPCEPLWPCDAAALTRSSPDLPALSSAAYSPPMAPLHAPPQPQPQPQARAVFPCVPSRSLSQPHIVVCCRAPGRAQAPPESHDDARAPYTPPLTADSAPHTPPAGCTLAPLASPPPPQTAPQPHAARSHYRMPSAPDLSAALPPQIQQQQQIQQSQQQQPSQNVPPLQRSSSLLLLRGPPSLSPSGGATSAVQSQRARGSTSAEPSPTVFSVDSPVFSPSSPTLQAAAAQRHSVAALAARIFPGEDAPLAHKTFDGEFVSLFFSSLFPPTHSLQSVSSPVCVCVHVFLQRMGRVL